MRALKPVGFLGVEKTGTTFDFALGVLLFDLAFGGRPRRRGVGVVAIGSGSVAVSWMSMSILSPNDGVSGCSSSFESIVVS